MKRIVKNQEPQRFSDWKRQDRMAHRPNWNRVSGAVKREIREALLTEQGYICCYCESRITIDNSHVEHFRPRKGYSQLQLEYLNMHCSCLPDQSRDEPDHCGHKKGSWFDDVLLISPLQRGCDRRFKFTADGEIFPRQSNDSAAETTIKRLGLDLPRLNARRAAVVEALLDLSPAEIRALLQRRPAGRFQEYFTTIKDVLG